MKRMGHSAPERLLSVKDSVFSPSNPFRRMAELCASLVRDGNTSAVLFLYFDCGADHRVTLTSVQLSLIALFMKTDVDMLVAARI